MTQTVKQNDEMLETNPKAKARRRSSRSKRDAIMHAAIEIFGRQGYESSKWADVAAEVGIGSTALYHYFESKLHCLYTIMAEALEDHRVQLEDLSRSSPDYLTALDRVLRDGFQLTDHEVFRMRVLVAEQGQVGAARKNEREETARELARERMRALEFAWGAFLVRGMENGSIPEASPTMLTRAVLGLNTSVWHWYRPGGQVGLEEVEEFFVRRQRAIIGVPEAWSAQET